MTAADPARREPVLHSAEIAEIIGPRSARLGEIYYRTGALRHMKLEDSRISAACQGSSPAPYAVSVEFLRPGRIHSSCTCPIGASGECKHIGALLWAWALEPASFEPVQGIDALIREAPRTDLEMLVNLFRRLHPEQEPLLRLAGIVDDAAVSPSLFAEPIDAVCTASGTLWEAAAQIIRKLAALLGAADFLAGSERPHAASALCLAMLQGMERRLDPVHFSNEQLQLEGAAAGILLEAAERAAPEQVELILRELAQLVADGTRLRQPALCIRALLLPGRTPSRTIPPAAERAAALLLLKGDIAGARQRLEMEGGFRRRAPGAEPAPAGLPPARIQAPADFDSLFKEMLRLLRRGEDQGALEQAMSLFLLRPEVTIIRQLDRHLGDSPAWPGAAERMLDHLESLPGADPAALVQCSLHVGSVDRAVRLYEQRGAGLPGGDPQPWLQLADALREEAPRVSLRIYMELAGRHALRGGRADLHEAGLFLLRARECCYQMDAGEDWPRLFRDFLQSHPAGGPFKRELKRAGLLA